MAAVGIAKSIVNIDIGKNWLIPLRNDHHFLLLPDENEDFPEEGRLQVSFRQSIV